uniref:Uncharacterized protein n=1 Tax=Malurus cyaneus samueli TaxID=2593467 RepID=A0A8C5U9S4_9PASS
MARPRLLSPGLPLRLLLLLLLRCSRLLPRPPRPLRPDQLQCGPGAPCFPGEWRCDGHPDCDDGEDEWAARRRPRPNRVPASATPVPRPGHEWSLLVHSAGLLSILVAAGSVAVWVLSKAKSISNTFSLEKASREQLMPDKSQTGSSP